MGADAHGHPAAHAGRKDRRETLREDGAPQQGAVLGVRAAVRQGLPGLDLPGGGRALCLRRARPLRVQHPGVRAGDVGGHAVPLLAAVHGEQGGRRDLHAGDIVARGVDERRHVAAAAGLHPRRREHGRAVPEGASLQRDPELPLAAEAPLRDRIRPSSAGPSRPVRPPQRLDLRGERRDAQEGRGEEP